ncbi:MAG: chemotaxis protein CheA [Tepidisphaera sp.]
MLANLNERVEQIARMVVLSDSGDLPGLVALQEQATVLASDLETEHASQLADLAKKIGALAEAIVLRGMPDVDRAFREIGEVTDRLQAAIANGAQPQTNQASGTSGDDELVTAWITGCEGTLTDLEGKLLAMERTPTDREVIGEIRRMMHTLKGECGVLSLHTAQKLCHEAETLIDLKIDAGQAVPIDPFLGVLDWLRNYVTRLSSDHKATPTDHTPVMEAILAAQRSVSPESSQQASTTPTTHAPTNSATTPSAPAVIEAPLTTIATGPVESTASVTAPAASTVTSPSDQTAITFAPQAGTEENLADFLCEARDHIASSEEALLQLDQDRENTELINTVFRAFHTIKGVSGFMALKPIVSLAHSAEQLLDGARSGTLKLGKNELDLTLASCDLMTKLLGVLEGATGPSQGDFDALIRRLDAAAAGTPLPEAAPPMRAEIKPAAEAEAKATVATPSPTVAAAAAATDREHEQEGGGTSKLKKSDQTVKVSTSRMDSLVTMVGELVIAQQMIVQDVSTTGASNQRLHRTLSHMGKMIRDLQEVSMSLRMVNLKSTFQKMTRLARDVSQKAGKQIEVIAEGEDVELDRNVVEAITDPLVHMIRNSCDHGVEGSEERLAAGKPATGHVGLRAYHSGGSIVIEISDDGRGLRREKLLAKAKAKGLLPPDKDEDSMPDSEVFALIFLPGFSTAEKVTDISGRGVGMDVVRRNIEALRGKIEIRSTPGKGTTFLLRLPLTMAIIDGMVVRVGKQRYVLPTLTIQQSFRPREDDIKTVVGVGEMVKVRGSMLPIYRLNRVLQLNEGHTRVEDALLIVMEADDTRFCLMVDEILGQQQVVIKTLTQTGQNLRGVSGGAILGDGRVALILEIAQVKALATEGSDGPVAPARMETKPGAQRAAA